jgi:transposase
VRGRIDLKYALSLELEDAGFDFSVLCEFRARLLAGEHDQNLLEVMLEHLGERGLVKARGKQRTDSTHVLAAIRSLNHLELVGETLRAALNARSAPEWLARQNRPDWAERYGARVEQYRLPKGEAARQALGEAIGADGHDLLAALFAETQRFWLCRLPRGCGSSGSSNSITTRAGCAGVAQSTSQPTPSLAL